MVVAAKVLQSVQATASPSKSLRPVNEEFLQVSIELLVELLLVIVYFVSKNAAPAYVCVVFVVVEVPSHELEFSFVNAAILACAICIVPLARPLAHGLVCRPVVELTGLVLQVSLV